MTDHEPERRAIREAMTRLLDGQPVRSDGKLTIKSLSLIHISEPTRPY